jgi:hypothetical protein
MLDNHENEFNKIPHGVYARIVRLYKHCLFLKIFMALHTQTCQSKVQPAYQFHELTPRV